MGNVIVVGSGISGMTAAIRCAGQGVKVTLISPFPSERSQSVMAAGGINAVLRDCDPGDSVACHVEDTLKGGSYLAGSKRAGFCPICRRPYHHGRKQAGGRQSHEECNPLYRGKAWAESKR